MDDDRYSRAGTRLTEEEFYEQEDEDSPYQFLGGELVVCEPISDLHEDLCSFLVTLLRYFLDERGGGVVRSSRFPMRLDPEWSPEPDIMVIRDERRHLLGPQRLEGPADLVIEVASPSDQRRALRLKLPRYRQAGVPEIVVVDPYVRSLRVEILEAGAYRTRELAEGRFAPATLPGFWIDVSWLWQRPLPSVAVCLRQILGSL
jgi:Uma2 family endonuclease